MERLVFTESLNIDSVPFTTSDIIAEFSGNSRESIMRLIRKYVKDLQEFGKVGFEIRAMPSGQKAKIYHLNKEQATLLITYLDNTAPVRKFKRELVRQFFAMESELYARRAERQAGKSVHHSLTDAIKESGLSPHFYKHFTDLAYKSALGYTAKQLRAARGVGKSKSPLDFLSADELMAVNEREQQIAMLITLDMEYSTIKELVNRKGIIYQTTLQMPAKSTVGA
ncbi:Rha family transcriptional regulator [Enterococcus diestrammenae]|uniref:Phage regulatory protein n=1 Tax=Enterococcus diestrammenae TaxID=1155073 RepID=A0ABV0F6I4_9ENTE|nr:Rha family transcriptional regulator [Enterococcus diestrammenae]KAF1296980.1 transcriptional regulator [Enterococcus diestrammenae]